MDTFGFLTTRMCRHDPERRYRALRAIADAKFVAWGLISNDGRGCLMAVAASAAEGVSVSELNRKLAAEGKVFAGEAIAPILGVTPNEVWKAMNSWDFVPFGRRALQQRIKDYVQELEAMRRDLSSAVSRDAREPQGLCVRVL